MDTENMRKYIHHKIWDWTQDPLNVSRNNYHSTTKNPWQSRRQATQQHYSVQFLPILTFLETELSNLKVQL